MIGCEFWSAAGLVVARLVSWLPSHVAPGRMSCAKVCSANCATLITGLIVESLRGWAAVQMRLTVQGFTLAM